MSFSVDAPLTCLCERHTIVDIKVIFKSETLILFMPALMYVWFDVQPKSDLNFARCGFCFGQKLFDSIEPNVSSNGAENG